jgi:hypothetical protein
MTVRFLTKDYGHISCNSQTKVAYFHKDDFESSIGDD